MDDVLYLKEKFNGVTCLSPWDKAHLVLLYQAWKKGVEEVGQDLFKIFMSRLIREIGLTLAQDEWSLSGLGIMTILAVSRLGVKG